MPDPVPRRLAEAQSALDSGRYRAALAAGEAVLNDVPADRRALNIRLSALAALGAIGDTVACIERRLAVTNNAEQRKSLVESLLRGCDVEGAVRFAAEGLAAAPDDPEYLAALIEAHLQAGRPDAAAALVARLPPGQARAQAWLAVGQLERAAAEAAELDTAAARLVAARAAAWRGQWDEACAQARAIIESGACDSADDQRVWPGAQCILAAAALAAGDAAGCSRILFAVTAREPDDPEPFIAAAVLALRERAFEDGWAAARAARARAREYLPVLELVELGLWALQDVQDPFGLNLRSLARRAPELGLRPRDDIPAQELLQAIDRFSGNYSPFPTLLRDGGAQRIVIAADPRTVCKRLQRSLQLRGFEPVIAEFDDLIDSYQQHPLTYTHRGEMLLWRGEYGEAASDFEAAMARSDRTVWSYIGLATAQVAAGDARAALATLDEGRRRAYVGPGAPAIRGEALRRLGRDDQAREYLEESLELRPHRVAAWLNLALAAHRGGDRAAVQRALQALQRRCPTFLDDVAQEAGGLDADRPAAFEHALVMMRGNRSSSRLTYFTRDGRSWCVDTTPDRTAVASGSAVAG